MTNHDKCKVTCSTSEPERLRDTWDSGNSLNHFGRTTPQHRGSLRVAMCWYSWRWVSPPGVPVSCSGPHCPLGWPGRDLPDYVDEVPEVERWRDVEEALWVQRRGGPAISLPQGFEEPGTIEPVGNGVGLPELCGLENIQSLLRRARRAQLQSEWTKPASGLSRR